MITLKIFLQIPNWLFLFPFAFSLETMFSTRQRKGTITHLDKHILILHHQRIGVNVAREWFALVGVWAVLQLAGDIQRLCSQTQTHTHKHKRQAEASEVVLANEERQPSPRAQPPPITRVNKVVLVNEELCAGEDRWPQRPIAFFAFNRRAAREPVPKC